LASDAELDGTPLRSLYRLLAEQAQAIGVRQLVVAVDDQRVGRQIFTSDRGVLRLSLALRCGAPVWTEPAAVIPLDVERRLLGAVADFCARMHEPRDSLAPLGGAVARALRYGWTFTLVCVDSALPAGGLRVGDTLLRTGPAESLLIVEAARDEEVPAILARLAEGAGSSARGRGGGRAPLTFGLVHCPGDGSDPDELVERARLNLADAQGQLSLRAIGGAGR
jgi:hypothetical protein